ncbi:MAG TPA: ammonium transporter [Mycobacteriales bacterium]|jgi:Amt family ammonium transporter|nr:ammonium transporter [Mycobacteriales bacterium]
MDTGSTAWILAATTAVMLMVPGLALFYGGMVGVRNVLNMIMMTFGAFAVVGVLWVVFGYSAVFGDSYGGLGLLGDVTEHAGLGGLLAEDPDATIPPALFAAFQLLFAGITVALISGAFADRLKYSAWLVFAAVWAILVYFPVAHWVFSFDLPDSGVVGGWIVNDLKVVDFAGGTAVHINAGAAALALVLVLGKRRGFPRDVQRPHNLPLVVLGAGILWFGWLGFNGGSALAANNSASVVVLNTITAACAGICAWLLVEKVRDGHATTLGAASGAIAALVAITPACGAVSPLGALAVGAAAGAICPLAIVLKFRFGYDDALDVVGVHLVGGILGTVLVGILGTAAAPSAQDGLLYGGGFDLLGRQALAALVVTAYSFVVSLIIAKVIDLAMGLRVDEATEHEGLDISSHAESGYDLDQLSSGRRSAARGGEQHTTGRPAVDVPQPVPTGADR